MVTGGRKRPANALYGLSHRLRRRIRGIRGFSGFFVLPTILFLWIRGCPDWGGNYRQYYSCDRKVTRDFTGDFQNYVPEIFLPGKKNIFAGNRHGFFLRDVSGISFRYAWSRIKKSKKFVTLLPQKKIISGFSGQRRLSSAPAPRTQVSRQVLPGRMQKPLPPLFTRLKKPWLPGCWSGCQWHLRQYRCLLAGTGITGILKSCLRMIPLVLREWTGKNTRTDGGTTDGTGEKGGERRLENVLYKTSDIGTHDTVY